MAKKSNAEIIKELQESLQQYKEIADRLEKRNKELVEAEEDSYLHSPTYVQMKDRIRFLQNMHELDEHHLKNARKKLCKLNDAVAVRDAEISRLQIELGRVVQESVPDFH